MTTQDIIEHKLREAFNPVQLIIENQSHLHRGHASSPESGESHFHVTLMSAEFCGKSRLECHRMVNDVLADELDGLIHALAISAKAPQETS